MSMAAAQRAAIDLRGLRKTYPASGRARAQAAEVRAVDGLDLRVERGEVFGLLGPNGAGKTTTVEICEGLLAPTAGEVRILGLEWGRDDRELRSRIGVTLQSTRFFDKQTVRELIGLFSSFYADPRPADEVLGLVALEQKADARFHSLSGGQQQRLAVACALAGRPELLFLDEPTTGLDPQARRQLWDVVRTFRADGGTVLLTTHYMEEAAVLCDRIMIVDHGRSIALGTPAQLVASLGAAHVIRAHFAERVGDKDGGRPDPASFARVPTVHDVTSGERTITLTVDEVHLALPGLLAVVHELGLELADLTLRTTTLDDVFVHLTGRQLRDGDEVVA